MLKTVTLHKPAGSNIQSPAFSVACCHEAKDIHGLSNTFTLSGFMSTVDAMPHMSYKNIGLELRSITSSSI